MNKSEFICCDCFKNIDIQYYIKSRNDIRTCSLCGKTKPVINSMNIDLINMMRGLFRYYYPEYLYNRRCGGTDNPIDLLFEENPIIKSPKEIWKTETNDNFESFMTIMDPTIGENDTGYPYPLYKKGPYDRRYDIFTEPISKEQTKWDEILSEMKSTNYNDLLNKYVLWARNIFESNTITLDKTSENWFRARIGYEEKKIKNEFNYVNTIKKVYSSKNIKAPPCMVASSGRCNREGISYLYLASDINTAIAEVRPEPGHYVSIGEFQLDNTINVVNLCYTDLATLSRSLVGLEEYNLFQKIKAEFETPLTRDILNKYLKSQFISDLIKLNGYDGLIFNSSVSDGKNLVLFDSNKAKLVPSKGKLFKIQKQRFDYGIVRNEHDGWRDEYSEVTQHV